MKECPNCKSCYEDLLAQCPWDKEWLDDGVPGPTIFADKFRIEARLGKGGMGSVYRAMHLGLKRYVALKTLLPQKISEQDFAQRFKREAEVCGRLKHPHIVDVMDSGFAQVDQQEVGYLAMEFLSGRTLRDHLKKRSKLTLVETVEILTQVCQGVDAAHDQGVIHRDLKPDNIWLEDQPNGKFNVKVLDFGIAKLTGLMEEGEITARIPVRLTNKVTASELPVGGAGQSGLTQKDATNGRVTVEVDNNNNATEDSLLASTDGTAARTLIVGEDEATAQFCASIEQLTQTGAMIGTLPYMSPEQCQARPCTNAADIYALGVIAYEMLTGQRPFRGKSFEVALQHIRETPIAPSQHVPDLPKAAEQAILQALAKSPETRPTRARDLAQSLAAPLVEAQRQKESVLKMLMVGGVAVAVLFITALIANWHIVSSYYYSFKVKIGLEQELKRYQSYTSLKLIDLSKNAELALADTAPQVSTDTLGVNRLHTQADFICSLSADSSLVAFCEITQLTPRVEIWQIAANQKEREFYISDLPGSIHAIKFSPDQQQLAIACINQVRLYRRDGRLISKIDTFENNDLIEFLPGENNKLLIASIRRPLTEIGIGTVKQPLPTISSLLSIWQTDGHKITDLSQDYGEIETIQLINNQLLVQWRVAEDDPSRRLELWQVGAQNLPRQSWPLSGNGGSALSADGRWLAVRLARDRVAELEIANLALHKEYQLTNLTDSLLSYYQDSLLSINDAGVALLSDRTSNLSPAKLPSILPANCLPRTQQQGLLVIEVPVTAELTKN